MKDKLLHDQKLLKKQLYWLTLSLNECAKIGIKSDYTADEFGRFETLCSRFSRSIDFLIRKIFRSIDEYELENQGTLIDVVNNAHKRGLIKNVKEIRLMKDIRNTIVHEYVEEGLIPTFSDVLTYSVNLVDIMQTTERYIDDLTR